MEKRFYQSQWGTDEVIDKLIYSNQDNKDKKGIFVEIGAYDGVKYSNTYYFEKIKDWTGILVEPLPNQYALCSYNRWGITHHGCVSSYNGYCKFGWIKGYSEMVSGIIENFQPKFRDRVFKEINQHKQEIQLLEIPTVTINSLLSSYNIMKVDYLSLDTVSTELEVLQAFDIEKNPTKIISLDTNGMNLERYLEWFTENNYEKYWKSSVSDEYIFVHKTFKYSWE